MKLAHDLDVGELTFSYPETAETTPILGRLPGIDWTKSVERMSMFLSRAGLAKSTLGAQKNGARGRRRLMMGSDPAEDLQRVEDELKNLRDAVDELTSRTATYETALEDLSVRRDEVAGRLDLARRQAADFANRLVAKEAELEETRKLAAYQTFKELVTSRDDAATHAASAIDELIAALKLLSGLQDAVAAAGRTIPPEFDVSSVEPPDVIESAWQRLMDYVRSKIEERLQDEAVEAAARSFQGYEINKLPEHLQTLARQLRADLTKDAAAEFVRPSKGQLNA